MSLRKKLLERSKVAGCVHRQTQLRNFPEISATANATAPRLSPANPHKYWVLSATSTATAPQPTSCIGSQSYPSKVALVAPPVTTVAEPPDDLWPRLETIANKCCDHWQDSAERRAEILISLQAMTPEWQRHWLDHLEASYGNPK